MRPVRYNDIDNEYLVLFNRICNESGEFDFNKLSNNEQARIKRTLAFIPQHGVHTILDVGCCDGRLSNLLSGKFNITSLDIGEAGLRTVQGKKIIASIDNLPFYDSSFDLVMCTEVFEHLPLNVLIKGIKELKRVAGRFILISVPYLENIRKGFTRCRFCNRVNHVYGHINSFSEIKLRRLLAPWNPVKRCCFGDYEANIGLGMIYYMKNTLGGSWASTERYLCPYCHKVGSPEDSKNLLGLVLERLIWKMEKWSPFKNRNRIIVLFSRNIK